MKQLWEPNLLVVGNLTKAGLIRLANEEILKERERCAKIAEESAIPGHNVQAPSCAEIAKKIRS